jgi:hypothetical protein
MRSNSSCGNPLRRSMRFVLVALVVLGAALSAALAGASPVRADTPAPSPGTTTTTTTTTPTPPSTTPQPAGPGGVNEGGWGSPGFTPPMSNPPTYMCYRHITVQFIIYEYFPAPTTMGCWGYNRFYQNTSTFTICNFSTSGTPTHTGSGPYAVFDDTNYNGTGHGSDSSEVSYCASNYGGGKIYAEYMGVTSCSGVPCWKKVAPVTITEFYPELYESNTQSWNSSLWNWWTAGSQSGVSPSTTAGTFNIGPDQNGGNGGALGSDITKLCNAIPNGGIMSLYAYGYGNVSPADENTIQTSLDYCLGS